MIGVCGAGSWGSALAIAAAQQSDKVYLWGREEQVMQELAAKHLNSMYLPEVTFPTNVIACPELQDLITKNQDILISVPSKAFVAMLQQIKPYLTDKHRIVWATKGLEPETGCFLNEVIERELGKQRIYAVLSGPSFAKEVARQMPTAVVVASQNQKFAEDLSNAFSSKNFRVYLSKDVVGVQIGGIIKNIIAVATGMADGLGLGANAKAALITRGIAEMMRFAKALGAESETVLGLSGAGDVILTATDNQSRNRRFGIALAQNKSIDEALKEIGQAVEAYGNAKEVYKLAQQHNIEMPITEQVFLILDGQLKPREAFENLLRRKSTYEWY